MFHNSGTMIAFTSHMVAPRMKKFGYIGPYVYSITLCCKNRNPYLTNPLTIDFILHYLHVIQARFNFMIWVYCLMPDHLHLVIQAKTNKSNLQKCVAWFKQMTGFRFKQQTGEKLWLESYFDRLIRDEKEFWSQIRYILENPVRAGLVKYFWEYPQSGSFVFDVKYKI